MSVFICHIPYIEYLDEAFSSIHYHEQSDCKTTCCEFDYFCLSYFHRKLYSPPPLSCYNGFLNGIFETKVRQNDGKKNISIRYIKIVNMKPNKNCETFHYRLLRGIIPWMTQSRCHYGDNGIFCQLFYFILTLTVSNKKNT